MCWSVHMRITAMLLKLRTVSMVVACPAYTDQRRPTAQLHSLAATAKHMPGLLHRRQAVRRDAVASPARCMRVSSHAATAVSHPVFHRLAFAGQAAFIVIGQDGNTVALRSVADFSQPAVATLALPLLCRFAVHRAEDTVRIRSVPETTSLIFTRGVFRSGHNDNVASVSAAC
ncbi:hypothetical protein DJICPGNB_05470 [Escherichia coli]|nr:hypothetical protein DJICPGNB_05470 [Escherichia coli]